MPVSNPKQNTMPNNSGNNAREIWFVTDITKCVKDCSDKNEGYEARKDNKNGTYYLKIKNKNRNFSLNEQYIGKNMLKWLFDYCGQNKILVYVISYNLFAKNVKESPSGSFVNKTVILTDDLDLAPNDTTFTRGAFGETPTVSDIITYCLNTDGYPKNLLHYSSSTQKLTDKSQQINKIVDYSDLFAFFLDNSPEKKSTLTTESGNTSPIMPMSYDNVLWEIKISPKDKEKMSKNLYDFFYFLLKGDSKVNSNESHKQEISKYLTHSSFVNIVTKIVNQRNQGQENSQFPQYTIKEDDKILIWLTTHGEHSAHDPGQKDYDEQLNQIDACFEELSNLKNDQQGKSILYKSLFLDSRVNDNESCLQITFSTFKKIMEKIGLELETKISDDPLIDFPVNKDGQFNDENGNSYSPAIFFLYTLFAYFIIMWDRCDRNHGFLFNRKANLHFICYEGQDGKRYYQLYRELDRGCQNNFPHKVNEKRNSAYQENGDAGCYIRTMKYLQSYMCPSSENVKNALEKIKENINDKCDDFKRQCLDILNNASKKLSSSNDPNDPQKMSESNKLDCLQKIIENMEEDKENIIDNYSSQCKLGQDFPNMYRDIISLCNLLSQIPALNSEKEILEIGNSFYHCVSITSEYNDLLNYVFSDEIDALLERTTHKDSMIKDFFGKENNVLGFTWNGECNA